MERKAEQKLRDWVSSPRRKPLIIRGARQTGKTWLVERVGRECFESVVKVDFEKRRDLHQLFSETLEPEVILQSLEILFGRIIIGRTLLFFDEIQSCPRALMSLRYFYEEIPSLHVIAAGSLLEFALSKISFPVGRVSYMYLHPMRFTEFLLASDKKSMAEEVDHLSEKSSELVQRAVLKELKNYFLVGGMPKAVKTWAETGSFREVFEEQDDLISSFQDDFLKYSPRVDIHCLDSVFREIPLRVGQQMNYASLDRTFTGVTNRKAFELLEKAELVHRVYATDPSGLPLGAGRNSRKFKAVFLDIGLMQRMSGVPAGKDFLSGNLLSLYQGRLAEQFIAQEMIACGSQELFYWAREAKSSSAEIDFLIESESLVVPVEVKSGKGGTLRSLHMMLDTYPSIPGGVVLYDDVAKHLPEQKLDFYPLYAISSLLRDAF